MEAASRSPSRTRARTWGDACTVWSTTCVKGLTVEPPTLVTRLVSWGRMYLPPLATVAIHSRS